MRDKWRADDYQQQDIQHRERGRRDRQERSPVASQRRQDPDAEIKIRGTAKQDTVARSSRNIASRREGSNSAAAVRHRSRSATGRPRRDNSTRPERSLSYERKRHQDRRDHRREGDLFIKGRRGRSRSPPRNSYHHREDRRRTRSPPNLNRTDRGVGSRGLDRALSPAFASPRIDHYSSINEEGNPRVDSYIPGRRRRSRSPALRDEYRPAPLRRRSPSPRPAPPRRRSPSPDRRHRPRERTPVRRSERSPIKIRDRSPDRYKPRKDQNLVLTRRDPPSREKSRARHHSVRPPRRRSPLPTQEEAKAEYTNRKRTRSPEDPDRPKHTRKEMYPSGHPLQNISDGAQNHGQVPMQQGYPIHDPSRRPPPVDTRVAYSASPQWTPPSHHVSPHSASPYSQGHVGWGGQQPYQGYVLVSSLYALKLML